MVCDRSLCTADQVQKKFVKLTVRRNSKRWVVRRDGNLNKIHMTIAFSSHCCTNIVKRKWKINWWKGKAWDKWPKSRGVYTLLQACQCVGKIVTETRKSYIVFTIYILWTVSSVFSCSNLTYKYCGIHINTLTYIIASIAIYLLFFLT